MGFKLLDHTADIKFEISATTQEQLFDETTKALASYLTGGAKISLLKKKKIAIEGKDFHQLMYYFIDELIYLMDAEGFIAGRAHATLKGTKLSCTLEGDLIKNYSLHAIKAATYSEMEVIKIGKGWKAYIVVDV